MGVTKLHDEETQLHLKDFYRLIIDFVKYYPGQNLRCKRPQAFGVIENYNELNTPTLGKSLNDLGKPFFWSRDWAKSGFSPSKLVYSYPIIAIYERPFEISDPFDKRVTTCYNFDLAILDKFDRDCHEKKKKCKGCAGRTINEIYLDTEQMLFNLFGYLKQVNFYYDTDKPGWYNSAIFNSLNTPAKIDERSTRAFLKSLKTNNKTRMANRFSGGLDDVYGVTIPIKYCMSFCDTFELIPNTKEYKVSNDRCCD